ncbi:glycosyltransferase [uncultured Paludibaculum sp.]|uniref:glycosyltransferase n=1 Tax=uncultured Paludibaculum sp. TaxID=1765020 RepID=UPI002AAB2856|nr:glycosyltransferase [uncultured Paludibaculum sp.]
MDEHTEERRPLRILHVLGSLDFKTGGPLRTTVELAEQTAKLGLRHEILGFRCDQTAEIDGKAAIVNSVRQSAIRSLGYSRDVSTWLEDNISRFDGAILHTSWLNITYQAARVFTKYRKPYVYFPHGMLDVWCVYRQGWLKAAKKLLYWKVIEERISDNAAAIFFTTEREKVLSAKALRIRNERKWVVPYAVSPERRGCGLEVEELQGRAAKKYVLFLGRIHPKKNCEFLIRAWLMAQSGSEEYSLVLAGPADAEYLAELKELVRMKGGRTVEFVDAVFGEEKRRLLANASWFVLPSLQENFGVAVLEAILAGVPVAISDQVYIGDLLHPDSVILPLEMDKWRKFFENAIYDEGLRARIIERDRKEVMPRFDIGVVAQQYARILCEIFAPRR